MWQRLMIYLGCVGWCLFTFVACGTSSNEQTVTVFAASSLSSAFTEIGPAFELAHPGTKVVFNFAASSALRQQLEEGAKADVFAPASQSEMATAVANTLIAPTAVQSFASNEIVLLLAPNNPANLQNLAQLSQPGLKLVIAHEEVPAGKYARQVLSQLNGLYGDTYAAQVLANVVSNEENVRQVAGKVQLGEADAGFVYRSDAVAFPELATLPIPTGYNVLAEYPVAPLLAAPQPALAQAFADYLLTPEAQAILQKWGFSPSIKP